MLNKKVVNVNRALFKIKMENVKVNADLIWIGIVNCLLVSAKRDITTIILMDFVLSVRLIKNGINSQYPVNA